MEQKNENVDILKKEIELVLDQLRICQEKKR